MAKHYGLTNQPNKDVKDKAPDWMNSLFKEGFNKTANLEKSHVFEGIEDNFLNPTKDGLNKEVCRCEICKKDLSKTDVDVCEKCAKTLR